MTRRAPGLAAGLSLILAIGARAAGLVVIVPESVPLDAAVPDPEMSVAPLIENAPIESPAILPQSDSQSMPLETVPSLSPAEPLRARGAEMQGREMGPALSSMESDREAAAVLPRAAQGTPGASPALSPADAEDAGTALGIFFDRQAADDDLQAARVRDARPDATPEGPGGRKLEPLELKFLGGHETPILRGTRTGTVRLIRPSKGSRFYWGRYKRGAEFTVLAGGKELMKTLVTRASTKRIGDLTKKDLVGVFNPSQLALFPVKRLRQALIEDLPGEGLSFDTKVRLIHFKSYPEVNPDKEPLDELPPAPRTALKIKADSPFWQMGKTLPRVILLDLDIYSRPIPKVVLDDIAKLQRTGVTLVAMSRRPWDGPGGASETLMKNMSTYQRDVMLPYRAVLATEGGAVISAFGKYGRVSVLEAKAFSPVERDGLRSSARRVLSALGRSPKSLNETFSAKPGAGRPVLGLYEFQLPKELDARKFLEAYGRELKALGLKPTLQSINRSGRTYVRASKTTLDRSFGRIDKALQDDVGVFALGGEMAVLSHDPAVRGSVPGAADLPSRAGVRLNGPELVENALGAMLGEHRINEPGEMTGSASRMSQFLQHHNEYLDRYVLDQEQALQNINFFSGHMVHKTLDWAVHQLRLGRRPSDEKVAEQLTDYWKKETEGAGKPVGLPPGHKDPNMREASATRTVVIYRHLKDIIDEGYKLVATEVPNFFVLRSYDKIGTALRRYIIHTIFDLIAIRPTGPDTAELVVFDFKSGPAQTLQKLAKDLQVLTYSLFLRYRWDEIAYPYQIVGGRKYKITGARVEFLYSPVRLPPIVNNWDLGNIERAIVWNLDRMHAEQENPLLAVRKRGKRRG